LTPSLQSLNSKEYPARVPLTVDHSLFFAITVGLNPCDTCLTRSRLVSAINNITFLLPTSLLEAHYYNVRGVFTDDFPAYPPIVFNYTGTQTANIQTNNGIRLYRLNFGSTVQIILQGTAMIAPENHPFHLHGYNLFVVGQGLGNFDPEKDPLAFNLVDPVERNTIGVPNGGWAAIRFRANNPGSFWSLSVFLFVFQKVLWNVHYLISLTWHSFASLYWSIIKLNSCIWIVCMNIFLILFILL